MTEWLKKHPNFLKVVGDNSFDCYSFKTEKGIYDLYKAKVFNPKNNYPIDWVSPMGVPNKIFKAPDFFKKLYVKLFQEYYEENKLRYLTHHTRMYLPLLIRCFALSIENGMVFLNHFSNLEMPIEEKTFPNTTKQQIEDLKKYLSFFHYELIISKETNEKISFKIH
jgi:hypothetical protein